MAKVIISGITGLKQVNEGSGVEFQNITFGASPSYAVGAVTSNASITAGGVYTISGNTTLTGTMPSAATVPGAMFIFRSLSNHPHALTGSQTGVKVFKSVQSGSFVVQDQGTKLALSNIVGASVVLVSDGLSYLVTGGSGSIAISQS